MMKKQIMLLAVLAIAVVQFWGCDDENIWGQIKGSGDIVEVDYNFSNFTRIDASHAFNLTVTKADSFYVKIYIDDNLSKYLDVHKSGEWLKIGMEGDHNYTNTHFTAVVHMPNISYLKGSGASEIEMSGFESESDFRLELSGASVFSANLNANNCEMYLSGDSELNLTGNCNDLTLEGSGASDLNMSNFVVSDGYFELSGASDGTIHVTNHLDVILSGASELRYYGSPALGNVEISGASSLIKL